MANAHIVYDINGTTTNLYISANHIRVQTFEASSMAIINLHENVTDKPVRIIHINKLYSIDIDL